MQHIAAPGVLDVPLLVHSLAVPVACHASAALHTASALQEYSTVRIVLDPLLRGPATARAQAECLQGASDTEAPHMSRSRCAMAAGPSASTSQDSQNAAQGC